MKATTLFSRKPLAVALAAATLTLSTGAMAATQQQIQQAIDDGLANLNSTATTAGSEVYWSYGNNGTLAATASAALAFIEDGYLPGDGSAYDATVTGAVNYIFNRATADSRYTNNGTETAVYTRIAEDYNNNGAIDAGDTGANNQAIYFNPGNSSRNVYTTGIVAPVIHALGEAYGSGATISSTNTVVNGQTYNQVMQDVIDWFSWGQVEPDRGTQRGGWRYDANYSSSDNSTAQWGALPMLYSQDSDWSLSHPNYVTSELTLWTDYIQNTNGGSGYTSPNGTVNEAKTGGLILELLAEGKAPNDPDIQAALSFLNSHWNNGASSTWYGNLDHPYAMWAIYKALASLGKLTTNDNGTPGDTTDDFLIGLGMSGAPGGFTIGFDGNTQTSSAGDWYSHYTDLLVGNQNGDGSWNGYSYWTGALATGWYINILNATAAPIDQGGGGDGTVPEPGILALLATGLIGVGAARRRSRKAS